MSKGEKLGMAAARLREIADNYPLSGQDKQILRAMARELEKQRNVRRR